MESKLKLYVWENVLRDYTPGLVCVLAYSEEEAWSLIKDKYPVYYIILIEDDGRPKPRVVTEPEAFGICGGG